MEPVFWYYHSHPISCLGNSSPIAHSAIFLYFSVIWLNNRPFYPFFFNFIMLVSRLIKIVIGRVLNDGTGVYLSLPEFVIFAQICHSVLLSFLYIVV